MRLGLWNIDHPEQKNRPNQRFDQIKAYLLAQTCDLYILTEANSALDLDGYTAYFSAESPFHNKSRSYAPPNRYHQVAIYSRLPLSQHKIDEPINGVLCQMVWMERPLWVYGNVVTIKDQWLKSSTKTYSDRLAEQLNAIDQIAPKRCFIAGDYNLKQGWAAKKGAYNRLKSFVTRNRLVWATQERTDTVQHVIHSHTLSAEITIDHSIKHSKRKKDRLTDHPFLAITISAAQ